MKKLIPLIAFIVLGFSSQVSAGEYIVDKQQYISELGISCKIQVYKGLTMIISVTCSKGYGNCSGHTWDGNFQCNASGGGSGGSADGVPSGINWILNNL